MAVVVEEKINEPVSSAPDMLNAGGMRAKVEQQVVRGSMYGCTRRANTQDSSVGLNHKECPLLVEAHPRPRQ